MGLGPLRAQRKALRCLKSHRFQDSRPERLPKKGRSPRPDIRRPGVLGQDQLLVERQSGGVLEDAVVGQERCSDVDG